MAVLDTDHLSILEGTVGPEALRLRSRLAKEQPDDVMATIISFEEQTRGWMSLLSKARTVSDEVGAYRRLRRHLDNYRRVPVLDFDEQAAVKYQELRKSRLRLGAMDLKIAAIVLVRSAVLLSRNLRDFRRVPHLRVEDWTA